MAAISGWGGRVTAVGADSNTYVLPVGRWSVTARMDGPESTTMEHFGHGSYDAGVNDHDVTFDCYWDTAVNPFNGNALDLFPGTVDGDPLNPITNYVRVDLSMNKDSVLQKWVFFTVLVTNVSMDNEVRGVVRFTVSGQASQLASFNTDTVGFVNLGQSPSNAAN